MIQSIQYGWLGQGVAKKMRQRSKRGIRIHLSTRKYLNTTTLHKFMQITCKTRCTLSVHLLVRLSARAHLVTEPCCQDQQATPG